MTCSSGTFGKQTIATTNLISCLTAYATLASPTLTGMVTVLGLNSAGSLPCVLLV